MLLLVPFIILPSVISTPQPAALQQLQCENMCKCEYLLSLLTVDISSNYLFSLLFVFL